MRRKKLLKLIANFVTRPIVRVGFYILGLALVLGLSGGFLNGKPLGQTIKDLFVSESTLSVFFAGLFSIGLAKTLSWFEAYMEESYKVEDNHHKIIRQYHGHAAESDEATRENVTLKRTADGVFCDKDGVFMDLHCGKTDERMAPPEKEPRLDTSATKRQQRKALRAHKRYCQKWEKEISKRNTVKDLSSKDYKRSRKSIIEYLQGRLRLCSVNVFTNLTGKTRVCFRDSYDFHDLPPFVISNADELLQAHKNSTKKNSTTVRLDDFTYQDGVLTLDTSRSTYYHMLITNRCMDYKFANGLSIRELYEYEKTTAPLSASKFGNQIGINGLVMTRATEDEPTHALVEKRSRNKVLWKNKFAQSISLALKTEDLGLANEVTLEGDCASAQEYLAQVIYKTLRSNFGLTENDFIPFTMEENFLGIARDLLEGGKPNLYFYIQTECTASELKKKLEKNVSVDSGDDVISTSKLDSDYYLIPQRAMEMDYDYRLLIDRKESLRVHRKLSPRCSKIVQWWDMTKERFSHRTLRRECGEALLVTLAYLRLCRSRLDFTKTREDKK